MKQETLTADLQRVEQPEQKDAQQWAGPPVERQLDPQNNFNWDNNCSTKIGQKEVQNNKLLKTVAIRIILKYHECQNSMHNHNHDAI